MNGQHAELDCDRTREGYTMMNEQDDKDQIVSGLQAIVDGLNNGSMKFVHLTREEA